METVIWPVYIDSTRSQGEGRKIPFDKGVKEPKISEILKAATKLKLNPVIEKDKKYPGIWFETKGRIIVERENISKRELLISISSIIKESRN